MSWFKLLIVTTLFSSALAQAEIYKCKVNGQTLYSDSKCADNAEKVDIVVEKVDVKNSENLKRQTEQSQQAVDNKQKQRVENSKSKQELMLEQEIQKLNKQMADEIQPLQISKEKLYNNPNKKRILEAQIKALTKQYQDKIQNTQSQLDRIRAQNAGTTTPTTIQNNAQ